MHPDELPEPPAPRHSRSPMFWAAAAILAVGGCLMLIPAVLLPALAEGLEKKRSTDCMLYLRQIGESMALYAESYDDRLPPEGWIDALGANIAREKFLHCPSMGQTDSNYGYAFNADLVGRVRSEFEDPSIPLVFDSTLLGRNAVAGFDSVPSPPRHLGENHWVRIDGNVPNLRLKPSDEPIVSTPKG